MVYEALTYIASNRKGEIRLKRENESFIDLDNQDWDRLYSICQEGKYSVYCGWEVDNSYYGLCIDWDNPFLVNGYADNKDLDKLSTMVLIDFKIYFLKLSCKSFLEIQGLNFDTSKITEPIKVYYAFGWIVTLKNSVHRKVLAKIASTNDYPDEYLEDSFLDKSLENIGKLSAALGVSFC